jgi:hypothetical protein
MRFTPLHIVACCITLWALPAVPATAADPQPSDPAILTMLPEPPPFREVISVSDWDQAYAKAVEAIGHPEQAKPNAAYAGESIVSVDPGSPAAQAGLAVGDVITEVDGVSLTDTNFRAARADVDHDQELTVINKDGESRKVTVHPGKLGIYSGDIFRPALLYLRGHHHDPKWDKYVLVGLANKRVNTALAETAWAAAMKAGYHPDWLSDLSGAELAWRSRRNDDALAYVARLQTRTDAPPETHVPALAYEIALANFKIPQALARRIAPDPGPPVTDEDLALYLTGLLKQHQALPEAQRLAPSPMELAKANGESDLLGKMHPIVTDDKEWDKWAHEVCRYLARHDERPWGLSIETANFANYMQAPKADVADVHLSIRMKVKPHDKGESDYSKVVAVGLVDCDDPNHATLDGQPRRGSMLTATFFLPADLRITQGSDQQVLLQDLYVGEEIANNREFTLHLYHAAGREEVWLNHRRLLYVPAPEHPSKVGFYVGDVGTTFESHVDFTRIGTK